ncbi:MAG: plastocyanin/azurin family copper-binding protein [Thermomicrobiales bacterium]
MTRAWWNRISSLVLAVLLGAALVACGNMDSGGPATGGFSDEVLPNQIAVSADPKGTLRWELQAYEGKAGDVTFVVKNPSTIAHNFVLEGDGVKVSSKTIGAKKSQNLTLKGLAAGEYQIICTLPGHREAGMVAKLTLK